MAVNERESRCLIASGPERREGVRLEVYLVWTHVELIQNLRRLGPLTEMASDLTVQEQEVIKVFTLIELKILFY